MPNSSDRSDAPQSPHATLQIALAGDETIPEVAQQPTTTGTSDPASGECRLTIAEALREGIAEEMRHDPAVLKISASRVPSGCSRSRVGKEVRLSDV